MARATSEVHHCKAQIPIVFKSRALLLSDKCMLRSNVMRLLICAVAFLTASCADTYAAKGAKSGAVGGAVAGAVLGVFTGNVGASMVAGAAASAAAGAAIGGCMQ
jgi:hypothetical protein